MQTVLSTLQGMMNDEGTTDIHKVTQLNVYTDIKYILITNRHQHVSCLVNLDIWTFVVSTQNRYQLSCCHCLCAPCWRNNNSNDKCISQHRVRSQINRPRLYINKETRQQTNNFCPTSIFHRRSFSLSAFNKFPEKVQQFNFQVCKHFVVWSRR